MKTGDAFFISITCAAFATFFKISSVHSVKIYSDVNNDELFAQPMSTVMLWRNSFSKDNDRETAAAQDNASE